MGSTPTQKTENKWPSLSDGRDFLQVLDLNSKPLGWIDSNGIPQGSLALNTVPFLGIPTGPCTASQTAVNTLTGDFFSCLSGSWIQVDTQVFQGAPSGSCLPFQTAVNSLTGAFYSCTGSSWVLVASTSGSLVSPVTSPNPLAFDVNVNFKGPNPYYDVSRYGVRNGSASTTATINSGSNSATLAAASTFQNGDGITIYGAGAAHTMTTPGAPTVAPSIARVLTATGDVVNGLTGATTYNYKIIARNALGGITAASTAGTTATGAASLGSQSVSISAMSRSNATVTVTTSAPHGLVTGAMVYITQVGGDATFAGWYQVSGSTDNTHFTFNSGLDTRAGATTSWTPGTATVFWFNCNHISWTAVTGAFQYYIYSDRAVPGTFALLGVSKPVNGLFSDGTLYWDDFGSPMMDGFTAYPGYIPSTAPASATSNYLVTTIVSGGGTTALTLANTAGTSVTGATALFDNAPNILTAATAANGSTLYFPQGGGGVINSLLDLSGLQLVNILGVIGTLNDTLILSGANWHGNTLPRSNTGTSFQFESLPSMTCKATPAIYIKNGNQGHYEGFQLTGSGTNNLLMMQDGGGGSGGCYYDTISFVLGTSDAVGIGFLGRSDTIGNSAAIRMRRILAEGAQNTLGSTATPIIYLNGGNGTIESIFMSGKGILLRPIASGSSLTIQWGYCQGGTLPFLTTTGLYFAGNAGGNLDIGHITPDTGAQPILASFASVGSFTPFVRFNLLDQLPSSGISVVTGNALLSIRPTSDNVSGQNLSVRRTIDSQLFANLGTPTNGQITFCPDCTIANPCAGGGTGALAKRLNGIWVCN